MERQILHCDLNNFYASVECVLHPELRGKPIAVGGSEEDRHGIVLAKSQETKKFGIITGETLWQARIKCPDLIVVPPNFEAYLHYSKLVRNIYYRYTDFVEPFGMDECWLDVTQSQLFGTGQEIGETIRKVVREETGLTISVGVSFNKIFAKLGSDMKKPDALTLIPKDRFREKIWKLPVGDLMGVGRKTNQKMEMFGIKTIGDLAKAKPDILYHLFGKNGYTLWRYANGEDHSRVRHQDAYVPLQSIGHGITCRENLETVEEVWKVIYALAQDVAARLRENGSKATKVQIGVKNEILHTNEYQTTLTYHTRSSFELAKEGMDLFMKNYRWIFGVRALTIRALGLVSDEATDQLNFFEDHQRHERYEKVEIAVDKIRSNYGKDAITYASLMDNPKMPRSHKPSIGVLPSPMYQ